jgi:hypothetical protein
MSGEIRTGAGGKRFRVTQAGWVPDDGAPDRLFNPDRFSPVTLAGRDAFLERFRREVDPLGQLSPDERDRRAQHLLKSHMYALSLRSAKARRQKAGRP